MKIKLFECHYHHNTAWYFICWCFPAGFISQCWEDKQTAITMMNLHQESHK